MKGRANQARLTGPRITGNDGRSRRNRLNRRLKVDLPEIEAAFDNASWEMSYYLDLETGRVVMITAEDRREGLVALRGQRRVEALQINFGGTLIALAADEICMEA